MLIIREAKHEEHSAIVEIANQSEHTECFTYHAYSGMPLYKRGWIRVADHLNIDHKMEIIGFTCFRHRTITLETSLYFIGVTKKFRSLGVGSMLLEDLMKQTPYGKIALSIRKKNTKAIRFFLERGFVNSGELFSRIAQEDESISSGYRLEWSRD